MTHDDLRRMWGSDSNIAKALGVSRQLVAHWRRKGLSYPRQCAIQIATKGRLRATAPTTEEIAA